MNLRKLADENSIRILSKCTIHKLRNFSNIKLSILPFNLVILNYVRLSYSDMTLGLMIYFSYSSFPPAHTQVVKKNSQKNDSFFM